MHFRARTRPEYLLQGSHNHPWGLRHGLGMGLWPRAWSLGPAACGLHLEPGLGLGAWAAPAVSEQPRRLSTGLASPARSDPYGHHASAAAPATLRVLLNMQRPGRCPARL